LFDIKNIIDTVDDFLAAGIVRDGNGDYHELHHSFLLVDVKRWLRTGSPVFGGWDISTKELPVIEKIINDNHISISFTGEKKEQTHKRQGWAYLEAAGNNQMQIVSLDKSITNKFAYCYPEHKSIEFWDSIQKPEKKNDLLVVQKKVIDQINSVNVDKIWLTNTEAIDFEIYNNPFYDTVSLPASGFKMFNAVNYLKVGGTLVIYDYSKYSLAWAKHVYESTSENIIEMVKEWEHRKYFFVAGSKVFSDTECKSFTKEALNSIDRSINAFTDRNSLFKTTFVDTLRKYRESNIKFIECDIFNSPEELTVHYEGNTLVSVSNIFSTDFSAINQPVFENQKCLKNFVNSINTPVRVIGQDAYCRKIDKEIDSGN